MIITKKLLLLLMPMFYDKHLFRMAASGFIEKKNSSKSIIPQTAYDSDV